MNLDRFCILGVILHLPILLLPKNGLILGIIIGLFLLIISIFSHQKITFLLGVLLCISYFQVIQAVKNAENITTTKQKVQFEITKILKQAEYQTAIARLTSGQRIYLNWQAKQPLILHQKYQAELNLRPISARQNMGNFDRQKWYFANHINMLATVRTAEKLITENKPFRTRWLENVKQQTESLSSQGLLLALAFGERAWLDSSQWERFQHTATAHLIAISGLHIGLAMALGFYFAKGLQYICLFSRINVLQAVGFSYLFTRLVGLSIAFSYSYLAGFSVPTVRALLAIGFILICQFLRRHYTAWQYWWRIVALLIILDPLTLLSDSFWLSILAVASLILWYQFFPLKHFFYQEHRKKLAKFNRLFVSLLHLQIGIWLIFSPVQLYFFEGISIFALIANLIIVPLYSFLLVPIILFSLLTNDFFTSWQLAEYLAQFSLWVLEPLSHSWINLNYWQQWQLLSVHLLIVLLLYCHLNGFDYLRWLKAMLFVVLFNLSFYLPKLFSQAKTEWIIFDVGQGLAMALIYDNDKAVIYDTGASWKSKEGKVNSMAQIELLPYLKRRGISVEALFLSHDDNDHSGGIVDLLQTYPNARLISSSKRIYNAIQPEACIKGKQWQFGEWQLFAIYPIQMVERAKNQDSCIILAKNNRFTLLLTGDSGVEQERQFVQNLGKVDFLQVGHHGSKSSTSETLLSVAQPTFAIISSGRWNPWKLPNNQVIKRLAQKEITVLNIAEVGMIKVKFSAQHFKIEKGRTKQSVWYKQFY
ncbi:DNA internalization-related competence protein ComEC/Rec2 [Mannheimia sp. AT1]|uniref:DNA internalization-related competence protein ComEC/Rec2 n=1 Tax=Mannheimia cairinae TaxID=3025936 RepID=A0ABT5MRX0_9PAST|nr:DNA internalization-related competence protein ComEC/Rec2 [Mannheimia cairinae]MDD0824795.1 DNA internalization-related competence protein ComEC/Rec2 [Mannheimia cairinae]MDD0826275.1 DNA internalization-related competence protein ComEC/Rec2 [Mannheimia cairinae]